MSTAKSPLLRRRELFSGGLALGALALVGASAASFAKPAAKTRIVMHRSPTCGCCVKWAERARAAGFDVAIEETQDIMAVKRKLGVPDALASCHTSVAGGYTIEGHVPLKHVQKLLATKPKVRGIAVPGMPLGSPGMEVPGYAGDAFEVFAFDAAGKFTPFRA